MRHVIQYSPEQELKIADAAGFLSPSRRPTFARAVKNLLHDGSDYSDRAIKRACDRALDLFGVSAPTNRRR